MFLIGVLGAILFAGSNASLAFLVKQFMKGTFVMRDPKVIWEVPLEVVVLFIARGISDYVANYYPSWVGRQVIKGLRHDVFAHYMRLPTAYLDRQQSGHLLSKLTNNIELVAAAATNAAISIISDSLSIVFPARAYCSTTNWRIVGILHRGGGAVHRQLLMQVANREVSAATAERIQNSMGKSSRALRRGSRSMPLMPLDRDLQYRGTFPIRSSNCFVVALAAPRC